MKKMIFIFVFLFCGALQAFESNSNIDLLLSLRKEGTFVRYSNLYSAETLKNRISQAEDETVAGTLSQRHDERLERARHGMNLIRAVNQVIYEHNKSLNLSLEERLAICDREMKIYDNVIDTLQNLKASSRLNVESADYFIERYQGSKKMFGLVCKQDAKREALPAN